MIFKYACVNEVEYDWGDDVVSKSKNVDSAIEGIERFIKRIKKRLGVTDLKFCFTSSPNFRYSVMSTYKHNRKDKDKPTMLKELRDYVQRNYKVKNKPRLEADDVLGILATLSPEKYIVCSIDKDLNQIAGEHYNWDKDIRYEVTPEEGDFLFYKQILKGDSVDGYKGCPYIGEKKATKLLNETPRKDWWSAIVDAYANKDLTEEDAIQQAQVARILRAEDWDFETDTLRLWTPKKGDG